MTRRETWTPDRRAGITADPREVTPPAQTRRLRRRARASPRRPRHGHFRFGVGFAAGRTRPGCPTTGGALEERGGAPRAAGVVGGKRRGRSPSAGLRALQRGVARRLRRPREASSRYDGGDSAVGAYEAPERV